MNGTITELTDKKCVIKDDNGKIHTFRADRLSYDNPLEGDEIIIKKHKSGEVVIIPDHEELEMAQKKKSKSMLPGVVGLCAAAAVLICGFTVMRFTSNDTKEIAATDDKQTTETPVSSSEEEQSQEETSDNDDAEYLQKIVNNMDVDKDKNGEAVNYCTGNKGLGGTADYIYNIGTYEGIKYYFLSTPDASDTSVTVIGIKESAGSAFALDTYKDSVTGEGENSKGTVKCSFSEKPEKGNVILWYNKSGILKTGYAGSIKDEGRNRYSIEIYQKDSKESLKDIPYIFTTGD